jgi:hypothetical protein
MGSMTTLPCSRHIVRSGGSRRLNSTYSVFLHLHVIVSDLFQLRGAGRWAIRFTCGIVADTRQFSLAWAIGFRTYISCSRSSE